MNVGDVSSDLQLVAPGGFLTIRPTSPIEIFVSNIFFDGPTKLYFCSATQDCLVATYLGAGRWSGVRIHIDHDFFLKLKNTSQSSHLLGYEGLITRSSISSNELQNLISSNWFTRVPASDNDWYAVTWSPAIGIFCAVAATGSGTRVMTSPDGITWTTRVSAADNIWYSVCWSPELSLFCAVA